MTLVIHPAIICHYFLPDPGLPSQLQSFTTIGWYQFIYCLVNKGNEQRHMRVHDLPLVDVWQWNGCGEITTYIHAPSIVHHATPPKQNYHLTDTTSNTRVVTFALRENVTEQTGAPSWARSNVFTHLLLTPSQIFMLPSFDAVTYRLAFELYFTCKQLLFILNI